MTSHTYVNGMNVAQLHAALGKLLPGMPRLRSTTTPTVRSVTRAMTYSSLTGCRSYASRAIWIPGPA